MTYGMDKPQVTRVRGRPKNRWMNCVLLDIEKCKNRKLEGVIKG